MNLTVRSAGRRYVALTGLRWLPIGLSIPVTVLLAQSRGLTLSEIGLVFVAHSLVALVLELPTGGLADAIGRRPVLVISGVLQICGLLVLAGATNLMMFAVAFSLVGAGRALDSGPLESWYVDAVHEISTGTDVTPGLSRASVADGLALSAGAVLGGVLPVLAAGGSTPLAVPILVGAALGVVNLVAVLVLVTPSGAQPGVRTRTLLRRSVREVPKIVRDTVQLATRDQALRLLLIITFLAGMVLSTLELLGPLRFSDLAGSRTDGTAVFGVVMAVSFGGAAVGSALAPVSRRAAKGSVALATAALLVLCAVALVGIALAPTAVLAGLAYAAFYLWNGAGWPLRKQVLHSRVDSSMRSTTVSASSFALMLGGIAGSLLLPLLVEQTSLTAGFATTAAVLLVSAGLSLRLPRADSAQTASAGRRARRFPRSRDGARVDLPHDGQVAVELTFAAEPSIPGRRHGAEREQDDH
jgi:predicted MFS family arabinose efflux permease